MPSLIPDDVRALGQVYGFSVEGYVNFEATRLRAHTLETTPLMQAIEHARVPEAAQHSPEGSASPEAAASVTPSTLPQDTTAKTTTP